MSIGEGPPATPGEPITESVGLASALNEELVGRVIAGKYHVREIVGRGGMGIVVRADHLTLDQPVALKFVTGASAGAVARFYREARIVFQLTSEHIVRLMDVGTLESGAPYLVMELVRGETLSQCVARAGPLPMAEALDYVLQACVGIAEAHRVGVVHRDLKPSNLMLTRRADGSRLVKVLDFGIAKILDQDRAQAPATERGPRSHRVRLGIADTEPSDGASGEVGTAQSALLGSPSYMSPEQIDDAGHVDARTDVWALGIILHELVTGRVPFDGDTVVELLQSITESEPRFSFADDPSGRALRDVVQGCLEKDPDRRYGDVSLLASALAPLAGGDGAKLADRTARVLSARPHGAPEADEPSPEDPPREPMRAETSLENRPRPRDRWPYALAITLLAVVAATALIGKLRRDAPRPSSTAGAVEAEISGAPAAAAGNDQRTCPEAMIYVPAGTFFMGTPKGHGHDDESPQRLVNLSAYCIDKTEVTVAAYRACAAELRNGIQCKPAMTPDQWKATATEIRKPWSVCNGGDPSRDDHPVNCVDWNEASAYCHWVAKDGQGSLPTEAQWERAARGVDGRTFPWGGSKPSVELVNGSELDYSDWRDSLGLKKIKPYYSGRDGFPNTAPVGSFPAGASPIGALDMAGNVWEWTADFYAPYDANALDDPRRDADPSMKKLLHAVRGGGWPDNQNRTAERSPYPPEFRFPDLGFRCVSAPAGSPARQ